MFRRCFFKACIVLLLALVTFPAHAESGRSGWGAMGYGNGWRSNDHVIHYQPPRHSYHPRFNHSYCPPRGYYGPSAFYAPPPRVVVQVGRPPYVYYGR